MSPRIARSDAGILPRDVLVSIDDIKINNINELRTALDNKTAETLSR